MTFTGPSSVVAGLCSTAYVLTLRDEQNNAVIAADNLSLNLNGVSSSSTALFYSTPGCGGMGTNSSIVIPKVRPS